MSVTLKASCGVKRPDTREAAYPIGGHPNGVWSLIDVRARMSSLPCLCFSRFSAIFVLVEVIEGGTDNLQRQNSDSSLLDRLGRCGVLL
jgi:hypothetical protein